MESETALHTLSDDELLRRLGELVPQSRRVEADLVAHIGEVDARRLFARFAFPSMFAYCTQRLHLSEAAAYRRITVARSARKHEVLLAMLRDGRLHLTGIAALVPLLTPENRDALLERATHRSKRQVEELVAELAPRPDVPSRVRKLPGPGSPSMPAARKDPQEPAEPARRLVLGSSVALLQNGAVELVPDGVEAVPDPAPELGPDAAIELVPGRVDQAAAAPSPLLGMRVTSVVASRPAIVEPLSPGRYRVQFTTGAEFRRQLERLTALMRSEVPDGDPAAVIQRAVSQTLERIEARRFARTAAPRKRLEDTDTTPVSRHIPAAVRRAVRDRDGDRCRYVDPEGRRCSARDRLEFHHCQPFGMGVDHSPGNIRLMCPTHNRYLAECDYGQSAMNKHRSKEREAPA